MFTIRRTLNGIALTLRIPTVANYYKCRTIFPIHRGRNISNIGTVPARSVLFPRVRVRTEVPIWNAVHIRVRSCRLGRGIKSADSIKVLSRSKAICAWRRIGIGMYIHTRAILYRSFIKRVARLASDFPTTVNVVYLRVTNGSDSIKQTSGEKVIRPS